VKALREAALKFVKRERAWVPRDRRARRVVVERCQVRHLLRNIPAVARDAITCTAPRRDRRFSSSSRARTHARVIDGTVHRWRRRSLETRGVVHLAASLKKPVAVLPVQPEVLVEGSP